MRSRTGWSVAKTPPLGVIFRKAADGPCSSLTCRARKLKCDETRPRCQNCQKGKRECRPSDRIVFRHQQNASMNGPSGRSAGGGELPGFYSYKNTFSPDSVWLEIPRKGECFMVSAAPSHLLQSPSSMLATRAPEILWTLP